MADVASHAWVENKKFPTINGIVENPSNGIVASGPRRGRYEVLESGRCNQFIGWSCRRGVGPFLHSSSRVHPIGDEEQPLKVRGVEVFRNIPNHPLFLGSTAPTAGERLLDRFLLHFREDRCDIQGSRDIDQQVVQPLSHHIEPMTTWQLGVK